MTPWDDTDFWLRYHEHLQGRGVTGYCRDGAGPDYWEAELRILFALKEPNAHRGTDMRDQLRKGPQKQIWHAFARWAAGILEGFPRYGSLTNEDLRAAMRRVAAINLKKATGRAASWSAELHLSCHADRELLAEQIRHLAPHLLIACGTFEPLVWILDLHVSGTEGVPRLMPAKHDRPAVLRWRHPARATEKHYHDLEEVLHRAEPRYLTGK